MQLRLVSALGAILFTGTCLADHSWGDYHWARTGDIPFNLTIINSTTTDWDDYVGLAVADWSMSNELNMIQSSGASNKKTRRQCRSPNGQVRICNLSYGNTGWLGIAGISIDNNGHIVTGYTKLNDYYFSMSHYNTPAWKQSVTCQELGHNVGLGHQDENFDNQSLFSCMDYQDPPFENPNAHDYEQLTTIYNHYDGYDSFAAASSDAASSDDGETGGGTCNAPKGKGCNKAGANNDVGWGKSLGRKGNAETFIRTDRHGIRHLTHVTWVTGH